MTIFQKYGPRADLGWPWQVYEIIKNYFDATFRDFTVSSSGLKSSNDLKYKFKHNSA
jgi:hypothetical protein